MSLHRQLSSESSDHSQEHSQASTADLRPRHANPPHSECSSSSRWSDSELKSNSSTTFSQDGSEGLSTPDIRARPRSRASDPDSDSSADSRATLSSYYTGSRRSSSGFQGDQTEESSEDVSSTSSHRLRSSPSPSEEVRSFPSEGYDASCEGSDTDSRGEPSPSLGSACSEWSYVANDGSSDEDN